VLALLLERVVELRTGETWPRVQHELQKIQAVLLESDSHRILQTTTPSPKARKLFNQMKIPAPRQILHLENKSNNRS
jgi:hypothetical protein